MATENVVLIAIIGVTLVLLGLACFSCWCMCCRGQGRSKLKGRPPTRNMRTLETFQSMDSIATDMAFKKDLHPTKPASMGSMEMEAPQISDTTRLSTGGALERARAAKARSNPFFDDGAVIVADDLDDPHLRL